MSEMIDREMILDYLREQQANVIIEKHKNGFAWRPLPEPYRPEGSDHGGE